MTEWNVLNSVIVLIAGGCAIGVAVLVLLICVGAKRRKMSVRSSFVPIWSAERPSSQVRVLLSEHELEASFAMTPFVDPNEALRGWHDLRGRALGDDMCAQIEQLKQECDISYSEAMMRTQVRTNSAFFFVSSFLLFQGTMEPRVLALRTSRHPHELHIGSLMVQTAYVIEKHALAVSSKLEREPLQDVPAYVRVICFALFVVCLFKVEIRICSQLFIWTSDCVKSMLACISELGGRDRCDLISPWRIWCNSHCL